MIRTLLANITMITQTKFIGHCYLNTMIVFRLIDRLLLNIQRSVWPTGATTPFDCHRKSMEIWIWTTISIFCSTYSFLKSTKDFLNILRVWHSPNTFLTMVHGQAFRIITWQPSIHHLGMCWAALSISALGIFTSSQWLCLVETDDEWCMYISFFFKNLSEFSVHNTFPLWAHHYLWVSAKTGYNIESLYYNAVTRPI